VTARVAGLPVTAAAFGRVQLGGGGRREDRSEKDAGRREKAQLHEDRTLVSERRTV
jgi:hypothetical protein